jgi:predicted 3-demethylubiquinone-9 3-methyltransferase (glyoxalase superfamily)
MSATTPQKITPLLMFEGTAEEAMTFYTTLFEDAEVLAITRYGADEAGDEGRPTALIVTTVEQRCPRCVDASAVG